MCEEYLLWDFCSFLVTDWEFVEGTMVITKCGEGRCAFCKRGSLDCDVNYHSICSGIQFTIDFDASCKTAKCIYLISCKICTMRYVGKTWGQVRDRFNGHRSNIRAGKEAVIMLAHFTDHDHGHGLSNMIMKPIEICRDKKHLKAREDFWIAELNTVFPYGLNLDASFGKIKNAYIHVTENKSGKAVYSLFNEVISQRGYRGGKRHSISHLNQPASNQNFDPGIWLPHLLQITETDEYVMRTCRSKIFSLELVDMKALFIYITRQINKECNIIHQGNFYVLYAIRDMLLYKLQKLFVKKDKPFLVIKHTNKLLEKVNIKSILNNNDIISAFPINSGYYATPNVSFAYSKSIRSSIVNYRQTISDPDHDNIVCHCHEYDTRFTDNSHGHIITGDMSIVNNKNLQDLLNQGLGYHDQKAPSKVKAREAFVSGLDTYITKTSSRTSTAEICFKAWRSKVIEMFDKKLSNCGLYSYNSALTNAEVKCELLKLQNDFVFTPIDKAANNVAIVCKRYYFDIIKAEIQNSQTFVLASNDKLQFLNDVKHKTGKYANPKHCHKIPDLYATVKMHKTPIKFRFITAARDTLLSEASIAASHCLKLLLKFARKSYKYEVKHIDNNIFILDNRGKVIKFVENSNRMGTTNKSISTWDFATLYTKIPHTILKKNMVTFIKTIMDHVKNSAKQAEYISYSIVNRRVYFKKSRSNTDWSFSADDLIQLIDIVIDNAYILFDEKVYRQVIGIPMGTNVAPYLANIFLHVCEHLYIIKLIEQGDLDTAILLSNTFRYQDDCIALNNGDIFAKHWAKMYPPEMTLECTNISKHVVTFLDLRISIFRGKFTYRSYDKRNDFSFKICNYPNLKGNVPIAPSYGVFMSQLVRFCEINYEHSAFLHDVKNLVTKFCNQGFDIGKLRGEYMKFCFKFMFMWPKYGIDISKLKGQIFSS